MLLVLTGIGGFAVDLGNWYWTAQRMQRAADAASLAAAPFLPGDVGAATDLALATLRRNGIDTTNVSNTQHVNDALSGDDRFSYHVYLAPDPVHRNRMHVEVGVTLHNYLVSLLGYDEQSLTRAATARFRAPIPMGSPGQVLGSEPPAADNVNGALYSEYNGKYWLNASGGVTDKIYGDRYSAGVCYAADECSAGHNTAKQYTDGAGRAHEYTIHVPRGITSPVVVQAYDAAFVEMGDKCAQNDWLGTPALIAIAATTGDPARYDKGPASPHCTGDIAGGQMNNGSQPLPALTLEVHSPAGRNELGAQLSTKTFPTVRASENLVTRLNSSSFLKDSFRDWYTLTTLNPTSGYDPIADAVVTQVPPGDYTIVAKTPDDAVGTNRFSLRVGVQGFGGWSTQSSKVTLSAKGHLTLFTNAKADETSFFFAKLTSGSAGRNLEINLYDIGDASDPVTLQLIPPSGSNISSWGSCVQYGPGTIVLTKTGNNCTIDHATPPVYNGRLVKLNVSVPDDYVCNESAASLQSDPAKCWMALRFKLENGDVAISAQAPSRDTTTWSITDCGRPVQLIQPDMTEPPGSSCGDD